jgi:hypothetical protein
MLELRPPMRHQPEIVEHIGTIESISPDDEVTGLAVGADVFVFDIVGDKGRGTVSAEFICAGADAEVIGVGEQRLEDGRTIELSGSEPEFPVE